MCSSRPSVALLAAALAACLPGTLYALHMAVNQRDGVLPADSPLGLGHWAALSAAALTTLFTAVLAGLCEARRVHGFSAAAAASLWALTCVAYPESAGALGRTWAGLALVWAAAFALLSHREARRERFGFIQQAPTKGKP